MHSLIVSCPVLPVVLGVFLFAFATIYALSRTTSLGGVIGCMVGRAILAGAFVIGALGPIQNCSSVLSVFTIMILVICVYELPGLYVHTITFFFSALVCPLVLSLWYVDEHVRTCFGMPLRIYAVPLSVSQENAHFHVRLGLVRAIRSWAIRRNILVTVCFLVVSTIWLCYEWRIPAL